jgi:hypothetical protein
MKTGPVYIEYYLVPFRAVGYGDANKKDKSNAEQYPLPGRPFLRSLIRFGSVRFCIRRGRRNKRSSVGFNYRHNYVFTDKNFVC